MPFVQMYGNEVVAVRPKFATWDETVPIAGVRVDKKYVEVEGSDGIGVVRPGGAGRITREGFLRLPNRRIHIWSYSSGEYDLRSVVYVSPEEFKAVMDLDAFDHEVKRIQAQARDRISQMQHETKSAMLLTSGQVVWDGRAG